MQARSVEEMFAGGKHDP